jgi:hypothetical protein
MNEDKARTIELGETAGEEHALKILAERDGISKLAATLKPRPYESYSTAFYELFKGGEETWMPYAMGHGLAAERGAHPYYYKAFDEVYARGARRCAEMAVRGYLDARAGVPRVPTAQSGTAMLEQKLACQKRRIALGDRANLVRAYELGYQLFGKAG